MVEQTYTEEIEYESLFDNIDDLIEFPSVTDNVISLDSVGCFDFADIWTNGSDEFNDPIFSDANCPSTLSAELAVPHEDVVQLEWLSNFVEDSFSGGGMTMTKKDISVKEEPLVVANYDQFQISSPVSVLESSSSSSSSSSCLGVENSGKMISLSSTTRGPQRARSKRPRPPSFNPRATSELPSQLTMVPVAVSMDLEKLPQAQNGPETAGNGPNEKKRKKPKKYEAEFKAKVESEVQNKTGNGVRKCMHCQITKTPQWRAGPMGPRTLCNACGVRHKSGRLFPEYRPAASPTFVPSLHSNSHKKVVEMRTKCVSEQVMGTSTPSEDAIPNTNL